MRHPRDRLGDYLEGDLEVGERASVEAHLANCPACREELRGLRATVALLRGLPDPAPATDLASSVMSRIESERRPAVLRGAFRHLPRVAAALAAGLAILLVWRQQPDDVPRATQPTAAEPAAFASPSKNAAGGATPRLRRPVVVSLLPSASSSPRRVAGFSSGVAPLAGFAELPAAGATARERELDRQLERLLGDPTAFLVRMGPDAKGDRFARLAQHAARRGHAGEVASRLIAVPHPLADDLVPRFLAASLAADFERRHGFRD